LHLSLLMFFQLCVVGSISPILSVYFKDYLGFSGLQVGIILSIASILSILSPFLTSWIVDRIITSRHLMIICHSVGAILMVVFSLQRSYPMVLTTYFLCMILLIPTYALINTLVFHNTKDSTKFGLIRVWGTIGWILAGWLVSFIWKNTQSPDNMLYAPRLSALFSLVVVFLTIKLPKITLDKNKQVSIIPREAFRVIIKPEVLVILLAVFISSIGDRFYSYGTPLFLQSIGVYKDNILIVLSLGQGPEIIMLFALAFMIRKFGFKNIFIIALIMQVFRFSIFYLRGPLPLTFIGVSLNGFIFALFYAASTIYLDNFTSKESRGGVHQLFSLVSVGISGLTGNLIAGWFAQTFTSGNSINFNIFWRFPLLLSFIAMLILGFFMKRISKEDRERALNKIP